MGMTVSRHTELSGNEFLIKFTNREHIPIRDPFWDNFFNFTITPPLNSQEQLTLDSKIESLCQSLLSSNLQSGNFATLLQLFFERASELLDTPELENNILLWKTFNILFVIRCIIKYLIETVSEFQLLQHFEAVISQNETQKNQIETKTQETIIDINSTNVTDNLINLSNDDAVSKSTNANGHIGTESVGQPIITDSTERFELFLDTLVNLVVTVPTRELTYALHLEAVNCLLITLSGNLFTQQKTDKSIIYKTAMEGPCSVHAAALTCVLLRNVSQCSRAPPYLYGNSAGGSFVLGFAAELWSMLTFSKKATGPPLSENLTGPEQLAETFKQVTPLANHSLLLLLVLTNHCTTQNNVYRNSLFQCIDIKDSVKTDSISFRIDFDQLFNTLCSIVCLDQTTLLLYLLLHRNQHFKKYVMSQTNLEQLVVPILKTLYNAPNSTSHHIYMSLIILLILSEDDGFNRNVHETTLKSIPWYHERSIVQISLGGLLILIIIRTIQYNMLKMRDKYLHTNCLAALANMSGQFRNLHPYVSQRLVSLFETLAKKHSRLDAAIKSQKEGEVVTVSIGDSADLSQDLSVLEEVLRMVLEILNSCLSQQLSSCPNLVYALLYNRHIFQPFRTHAEFQDIIQNIDMVVGFFSSRLKRVQEQRGELDVNEVLATIHKGASQWSKDRLRKFPELKFKYVEEESPEDFFIPYVWGLVLNGSGLHFSTETMATPLVV